MPTAMSYYGSKSRLANAIIAAFPAHHRYVETCAGSAEVLIRKQPSAVEVLNDRDHLLVNFYSVLRSQPRELQRVLHNTPYSREEHLRCRKAILEGHGDSLEMARCFYAATCQSFSGIVGDGFSRSATKPLAKTWRNRVNNLPQIAERLRTVVVENLDILEVVKKYDTPNTLFYVDPPYLPETRTGNRKYRFEMTPDDHCAMLTTLTRVEGKVLLSGYESNLYSKMLANWRVVWRKKDQKGSATRLKSASAQYRTEVLWAKP